MRLSICIPTRNRPVQLRNCLNSIYLSKKISNLEFDVCISDNGSNYDIKELIKEFDGKIKIKVNCNKENIGYQLNLIKTISMSDSEFVWAIGDDDLILPDGLVKVEKLLKKFENLDFFYVNSFCLDYGFIKKFDQPFDTNNLPKNMIKLSQKKEQMECTFWDLIDYKVSFDFLMGNFTNIFRRKNWNQNINCLDEKLLQDHRVGANLDSTCGYIKIYANAFKNSKALFYPEPVSVNCSGIREWSPKYELIEIVILPKILDYYFKKGLSLKKYLVNKNYALRNFANYFFKILIRGKEGGLQYINFYSDFVKNLIFPNAYLSIFYFVFRKLLSLRKNK